MTSGPTWVSALHVRLGPELSRAWAETLPPNQAALRRRAGDFRAVRFTAGLRRALPARFAVIFLFDAGLRREADFFFAIFAMVGSLFLFSQMVILPKNESTILEHLK
jgi:hypothetical protein